MKRIIMDIVCFFIYVFLVVGIILLILNHRSKHKYSCHDDEYFYNGFHEAMNDYGLNIDISSEEFENNYEDAYNALIDMDIITNDYNHINEEQIYISGYLAVVKAFNFDSSKIDINFNNNEYKICDTVNN